jgi:Tfp pilus assembly PilM family ATPase
LTEEKVGKKTEKSVLSLDLNTALGTLGKAITGMLRKWNGGRVVTLDIDGGNIRLLEIKGGVVRKWADATFEPDEEEGNIVKALGVAVKQLMASSGIRARKVIVSLSGRYTVSRLLPQSQLPPAPTVREAVMEIAGDIVPLPEYRRYMSWQTLQSGESEPLLILAVAAPREIVDTEVQALKTVGIDPYVVELRAMALNRLVSRAEALILNIDSSSFDIVVKAKGIPEVMRTIPWRKDGLSPEDVVEYIATSLETTVDFHNAHHAEEQLGPGTPLFITGQLAINIDMMERLRQRLSYPVEPMMPPLKYPAALPVLQYAVNLGLALRGASTSADGGQNGFSPLNLNLLPDAYRPWRPSARQVYSTLIILVAFSLLVPLFQIADEKMSETKMLQNNYDTLQNQLALKQSEIQRREPLQKAVGEYRNIVNRKVSFKNDIQMIFDEAEKLGVTVEGLGHSGTSIKLSCQAGSYLDFRAYLTALEESGRFVTPIPAPPEGFPYTTSGTISLQPNPSQ